MNVFEFNKSNFLMLLNLNVKELFLSKQKIVYLYRK